MINQNHEANIFAPTCPLAEGYLCALPGCTFELFGIDSVESDPRRVIKTYNVYWDTGSYFVAISADLLDEKFAELRMGTSRLEPSLGVCSSRLVFRG